VGRRGRKPREMRAIAKERIKILMELAIKNGLENKIDRADRYVYLARKIGMKYNVRIPRKYKRFICKKCKRALIPGITARVRIRRGKVVYTCLRCGGAKRYILP